MKHRIFDINWKHTQETAELALGLGITFEESYQKIAEKQAEVEELIVDIA